MRKVTINLKPSCFIPECEMVINVPKDRDLEEFIDEYLDSILEESLKHNAEWEVV